MKKSKKTLSENGITRRTFINQVGKAGAIGLILSTGIPPAKAGLPLPYSIFSTITNPHLAGIDI